MKRLLMVISAAMIMVSSFGITNTDVYAASETEINRQLQIVKQEIQKVKQLEKKATEQLRTIQKQQKEYVDEVAFIDQEIDATKSKLASLDAQIEEVEGNLEYTNQQLKEAEERVAERDKQLKIRLQFLYMHGFVNYLDVLLSSTSFIDFIDRLSALQSIIKQDKTMLVLLGDEKRTVENKKKDIEAQLDYVGGLLAQTNELKKQLESKRNNKVVVLASLETKEEQFEELSEEQEEQLLRLVDEQSKLIKKQNESKKKKTSIQAYTGGQLLWPLPASHRITSYAGGRINPITKKQQNHSGLDIGAPGGSDILAAASGTVVLAQWYGNFGNTVIIEHKDGFRTLYAHIRSGGIKVKAGEEVSEGDKIAEVGSTGRSTGNHLHFGVYVNNKAVDPIPYVS